MPYTIPDYSGSGINAFHFARFLSREGENTTLLTFNRNLKLQSKEMIEGVPVRRIPYFNRNTLTKILSIFIIFPMYFMYVLRHEIILIYGAHVIGYQLIIACSRCLRKKIIFRSLMMGTDDMRSLLGSKKGNETDTARSMFDWINLYFAINPVFADLYKKHVRIQQKLVVSTQGFDPLDFKPVRHEEYLSIREKHNIDETCFVILSVGFMIPRKGYPAIFEALADLDFDFSYYIIGELKFGKDHFLSTFAGEAERIKEYGLALLGPKLHLEGPKRPLVEYYQMADLVILNSSQEGISNALIESMACGKPVLCREIPGLRDYIIFHETNGLLFSNGSDMRAWINKLYRDPDFGLVLGRAAAEFIYRKANFRTVWERLLEGLHDHRKR